MANSHALHVVLVQPVPYLCPWVAAALNETPSLQLTVLTGAMERLMQALPSLEQQPDAVLIYSPTYNRAVEQGVSSILSGTAAQILLLLTDSMPAEPFTEQRVGALRCPRPGAGEEGFLSELLQKLRAVQRHTPGSGASEGPVAPAPAPVRLPPADRLSDLVITRRLIAVGASTGGTEALATLFHGLPPRMPGIVVVQHMPPVFTKMYAQRLDRELPFTVCEATDNELIEPCSIHIAPGDRHLLVERRGNRFYTKLGDTEKVSGHCPSVDALFASVAKQARGLATGVILTGMGADGAVGMREMHDAGAYTIGQDEASCVVYGMPRKAYENGALVVQAPLNRIAQAVVDYLSKATI